MEIPWNLILPDKTLQSELNQRLTRQQRPFIFLNIVLSALCTLALFTRAYVNGRWTEPSQSLNENLYIILFPVTISMCLVMLTVPKLATITVLIFRTFICAFIVYGNIE